MLEVAGNQQSTLREREMDVGAPYLSHFYSAQNLSPQHSAVYI